MRRWVTTVERISFGWGFAEATLFFIVPDVWVSFVALRGDWRWVRAALIAGLGAVLGGSVMYGWGRMDPNGVLRVVEHTPPVSWEMISDVDAQISQWGWGAMVIGAFTGRPYKVYASMAGVKGLNPIGFLVATYPARLLRFLIVGGGVVLLVRGLHRWIDYRRRVGIHIVGWLIFYTWFFWVMEV